MEKLSDNIGSKYIPESLGQNFFLNIGFKKYKWLAQSMQRDHPKKAI